MRYFSIHALYLWHPWKNRSVLKILDFHALPFIFIFLFIFIYYGKELVIYLTMRLYVAYDSNFDGRDLTVLMVDAPAKTTVAYKDYVNAAAGKWANINTGTTAPSPSVTQLATIISGKDDKNSLSLTIFSRM